MTSSTSSSSSVRRLVALVGAIASLAGCAGAPPAAPAAEPPRAGLRVLVLPPENLAVGPLPSREVTNRLEQMAAMAGADVIGGQQLEDYLARYRIRYTGGVDPVAAKAAREDLGADAILVTTVTLWGGTPPQAALVVRLVSTADIPAVLWMDGFARTGDDSPGVFALNIVYEPQVLQAEALQQLRVSLEAYLGSGVQAERCGGGGWWRPRIAYRARPDQRQVASVAVLPFVNETRRRGAGEVVALEFARQFASADGFRLVEPGIVRDELLRRRIVMEDGVSLDQARVVSASLDADLVRGRIRLRLRGRRRGALFQLHRHGDRPEDRPGDLGVDLPQQGVRLGDALRVAPGEHSAPPHLPDGPGGDRRDDGGEVGVAPVSQKRKSAPTFRARRNRCARTRPPRTNCLPISRTWAYKAAFGWGTPVAQLAASPRRAVCSTNWS